MPKVSVIMGIYNCANTLEEALDSLLAQTFQDFEVVICDDGSKDNTVEVGIYYFVLWFDVERRYKTISPRKV